jgi:hypothetical protein
LAVLTETSGKSKCPFVEVTTSGKIYTITKLILFKKKTVQIHKIPITLVKNLRIYIGKIKLLNNHSKCLFEYTLVKIPGKKCFANIKQQACFAYKNTSTAAFLAAKLC